MKYLLITTSPNPLYTLVFLFLLSPIFSDAQLVFKINSPFELAGEYPVGSALFGPEISVSDTLSGTITVGGDGSMNPTLGCEQLTTDLSASIGLLDRGECAFNVKAENAQNAGATALIIANTADEIINMPGTNPNVTIPSFLIEQSLSTAIRDALQSGDVEVNIFRKENIIWGGPDDPNSTFDGGLNDWTAVGIRCSNNANNEQVADSLAQWEWRPNPFSQGAFWGTRSPLASPTADNGAVIFDSDFYDNGGDQDSLGTGDCPAPQTAQLISPVIDLSDNEFVALTFYQYYRVFEGPTGDLSAPASFVEVSPDNGQSWQRFEINEDIDGNEETSNSNQTFLDISDVAGNQSEVQIRFVWEGVYYFWMIDDVVIRELPETNVSITETFNPLSAFAYPAEHIKEDTFGFRVNFINEGFKVDSLLCEVQVFNADNNEILHEQKQIITNVANGIDTVVFDNLFAPEIQFIGNYLVRYRIDPSNLIDLNYSNNFESYAFKVTEDIFSMDDPARTSSTSSGTSPDLPASADSWVWGNGYYISKMNLFTFPQFLGSEHIFISPNDAFTDEEAVVLLLEFAQNGRTFDFDLVRGHNDEDLFRLPTIDHPAFNVIAFAPVFSEKLQEAGSGNLLRLDYTDFFDAESNEPFQWPPLLNQDRLYFLVTQISDQNVGRVRVASAPTELQNAPGILFWPNDDNRMQNWPGFSNTVPVARLVTNPRIICSTENQATRDENIDLYPQPAKDNVYINLDLENPSDVELKYINMSGQVVKTSRHKNIWKQTIQENVSTISAGPYFIKVSSMEGIKTTKVIVIK